MQFTLIVVVFVLFSAKVHCSSYPTSSSSVINDHRGSSCEWSEWGRWSDCSNDCGSGIQTRRRQCECVILAGTCEGESEESRNCESSDGCDESECRFGDLSEWSTCSDTCNGLKYRKQLCMCGSKVHNDSHCRGLPIEESEVCNSESDTIGCCNWEWINNWSNANTSCCPSDGTAWRRQACMCAERGLSPDTHCANRGPFQQERKRCVDQPNCHHKPSTPSSCHWIDTWSEWSSCSSTHGLGSRFRSKVCSCGDPQLCPYPAPLDTESCIASEGKPLGVWAENNVTSECDTPCGVGAYWIGATCVCEDSYCDISHCVGLPRTHRQVCVGHDCPTSCEWEVTVSGCDGSEVDDDSEHDYSHNKRENRPHSGSLGSIDDEQYDQNDIQLIELLDEVERKFLEEKKNLLKKFRNIKRITTRRCMCGGVESNSHYCSPALEVYEEEPCQKEECIWQRWSSWSTCDDEGKQTRTRECSCQNQHQCTGSNHEERACFDHDISISTSTKEDTPSSSSSSSHIAVVVLFVITLSMLVLACVVFKHVKRQNRKKQLVLIY